MQVDQNVGALILEKSHCQLHLFDSNSDTSGRLMDSWNLDDYLTDDGLRYFEEIGRRLCRNLPDNCRQVVVSMPGTISNARFVKSSSRLGIKTMFDAGDFLSKTLKRPVKIVHDVDCMLLGYIAQEHLTCENIKDKTLSYIVVDEGVGSSLMINGKLHHGAGIAGHISRLIVERNGVFFQELSASGTLESYTSRSWISRHCVERYEAAKYRQSQRQQSMGDFRTILEGATAYDKTGLSYEHFLIGIAESDSILVSCLSDAINYLAQAISSIIAIVHPNQIMLAGSSVSRIPYFYENLLDCTETFSWPAAWNNVSFVKRDNHRKDQIAGAAFLARLSDWSSIL